MCGIAGKVSSRGPVKRELVESMCAAQVHRGPDDRGIHLSEGAGLGIQRLRVIDLETGDQPIYNEDGTVAVVLNGEIYNYRELRAGLLERGHTFTSEGDTEVIAHLYEELGAELVEHLDGMFAFAVWDQREKSLLLARDRVGKKPLFYFEGDGWLSFASELNALVQDPDVPRNLDPASVDEYMAYGYVNAPASIYRGVRKLGPAHTLVWSEEGSSTARYWQLDYEPKTKGPQAELEEELRRLVGDAVEKRLIADVPLGAFLSGGIDSSIVVTEMQRRSGQPVKTFSIGFTHEAYNELPRARLVAEQLGTEHHEFILDASEEIGALIPDLAHRYGEPFADSSAIPSFILARETRKHVTVALNGDGGDESFAGYPRHLANAMTAWLDRIPPGIRNAGPGVANRLPNSTDRKSRVDYARRMLETLPLDAPERYGTHVGIFSEDERRALYTPDFKAEVDAARREDPVASLLRGASDLGSLDRILHTDVLSYLPGDLLVKADIATMACSLEARSPLLDPAVMQFAASLPRRAKLQRTSKKALLRSAYRRQVSDEILDGKKMGFGVPLGSWLREGLNEYAATTLASSSLDGIFESDVGSQLLSAHVQGRDRSAQIFSLMSFAEWNAQSRLAIHA